MRPIPTARLLACALSFALAVPACTGGPEEFPRTSCPPGPYRELVPDPSFSAETPLPAGAARVDAVRGLLLAQIPGDDARWLPVAAGAELPEGARLRTGDGAGARLVGAEGGLLVGADAELLREKSGWRTVAGQACPLDAQGRPVTPAAAPTQVADWSGALAQSLAADARIPRLVADLKEEGKHAALEMKTFALSVQEDAGVAHATVDVVFANRAARDLEGTFYYAVPEGAVVTGFEMQNGDRWVKGEVVEREKARQVFEYIKRQQKDPALLEWAGGNLFKMRVYPIPAKGVKRLRLSFAQVLPSDGRGGGLFRFPLACEAFRALPLEQLEIHADSTGAKAQSPSHPLDKAGAFVAPKFTPGRDLELRFPGARASTPAAISLAAYRAEKDSPLADEAGVFLLRVKVAAARRVPSRVDGPGESGAGASVVSPALAGSRPSSPAIVAATRRAAASTLLLLDGTASMGAQGFAAALAGAEAFMAQRPGETFRVAILGQTRASPTLFLPLAEVKDAAQLRALAKARLPIGGNDFAKDLSDVADALGPADRRAVRIVYFGDGVPSIGAPDDDGAQASAVIAQRGLHLDCVAVGAAADADFLRRLARAGGGRCVKLAEAEDAAAVVADLLDPAPRVENVRVTFEGAPGLGAVHGAEVDEMPVGGEFALTGRVPLALDGKEVSVVVRGERAGEPFEERHRVRFALKPGAANADLPRLWAAQHIRALLAGEFAPAEGVVKAAASLDEAGRLRFCREQAIATSVAYQIPSLLTSYLVLESEADYARYHISRTTRRVDWRGEGLGMVRPAVKAEVDGQASEAARFGQPLQLPMEDFHQEPDLPAGFYGEKAADFLLESRLEAPGLRAMWNTEASGGGGGGGASIFSDSGPGSSSRSDLFDAASFRDAPSFNLSSALTSGRSGGGSVFSSEAASDEPKVDLQAQLEALAAAPRTDTPERAGEGWEAFKGVEVAGFGEVPSFNLRVPLGWSGGWSDDGLDRLFTGWRKPAYRGGGGGGGIFTSDAPQPVSYTLSGSPLSSSFALDGMPLSGEKERLLPMLLARRQMLLHPGADAAGLRAKWDLLRALDVARTNSEAQCEAWRAEALGLIHTLLPHASDLHARACLRLWEAAITKDAALRHAILWEWIAPGVGEKAMGEGKWVPVMEETATERCPAEVALERLAQEEDPACRAEALELYVRLALRGGVRAGDFWLSAAGITLTSEMADRLVAMALADTNPAALCAAMRGAMALPAERDPAKEKVRKMRLGRVVEAIQFCDPEAVLRSGWQGRYAGLVGALKELGRGGEVLAFAERCKREPEGIKAEEWSNLLDALHQVDAERATAFKVWLLAEGPASCFDAALQGVFGGSSDENLCRAVLARLRRGDLSDAQKVAALVFINNAAQFGQEVKDDPDFGGEEKRRILAKEFLLPMVMKARASDGDASLETALSASNLFDLPEEAWSHWLSVLEARVAQAVDSTGVGAAERLESWQANLRHARWALAQVRHQSAADFCRAQWENAKNAKEACAIWREALADRNNYFDRAIGQEESGLAESLLARFPTAAAELTTDERARLLRAALSAHRPDLAQKWIERQEQANPQLPTAIAVLLEPLRAHAVAGDAGAQGAAAEALMARCEEKLPPLAQTMAQAAATLEAAVKREAPLPDRPKDLDPDEKDDVPAAAARSTRREAWNKEREAMLQARDLRLKSCVKAADEAAKAWGAVDSIRQSARATLQEAALRDGSARRLWLAQLDKEAKAEDPVLRPATTGRLMFLARAQDWPALRGAIESLAQAEPADPVWGRWLVQARWRAGDAAGALAALRALAVREPLEPEIQLRLFAVELPGLSKEQAVKRAKALPMCGDLADEFKAWIANQPEVQAAYWEGKDAKEAAQAAEEARTTVQAAQALWQETLKGDLDSETELEHLLVKEEVQAALGAQIREWKPKEKKPETVPVYADPEILVGLAQAQLAAMEKKPEVAKAALRRALAAWEKEHAATDAQLNGDDRLLDALFAQSMVEEAVTAALRVARPGDLGGGWANRLISRHQGSLSPAQELRLRELDRTHGWRSQDIFHIVSLLCQCHREAEAVALATAQTPALDWGKLAEIAVFLRSRKIPSEAFDAALAKRRENFLTRFAAWLADGRGRPAAQDDDPMLGEIRRIRESASALAFPGDALVGACAAAETRDDPAVLLRCADARTAWSGGANRLDDPIARLHRRVAESAAATTPQKCAAYRGLASAADSQRAWVAQLGFFDALDRLDPATADERKMPRFEALWRLGRKPEADAIAQAWLEAAPLRTPEDRRTVAQLLLRAQAAGLGMDADDLVRGAGEHLEALAMAANHAEAPRWEVRARMAVYAMKKAMGEDASASATACYRTLAAASWKDHDPDNACQAVCDGLAASPPPSLTEDTDHVDGARHVLEVGAWNAWQELIDLNEGPTLWQSHLDQISDYFLTRVLPAKGDHPHIRLGLALAYESAGRPATALPHWQALVALAPGEPMWRSRLVACFLAARMKEEALAACVAWMAFDPRSPEVHEQLAEVLKAMNHPDEALLARAGGADAQPKEATGHLAYAEALLAAGRQAEAQAAFRRAIAARPTRFAPVARFVEACALPQAEAQALYAAGLRACDKAIADLPEDPFPHLDKMRFLDALGRGDDALDLARRIRDRAWPRFEREAHHEANNFLGGR